jgi:SAM-dependent methyltransferase
VIEFYAETLRRLLKQGVLRQDHRILVLCGDDFDRLALQQCGFTNVTISNVDYNSDPQRYAPYRWAGIDAEDIAFDDEAFDACIAHSGLHHCRSPHRALLEMYRVARSVVVVFEPLDNAVTRLGVRLGFGQDYELAAVAGNAFVAGGVRNTAVPNYVYRWTARDVEKTINANAPIGRHRFVYFYSLRINRLRQGLLKSRWARVAFGLMVPCAKVVSWLFPRQSNNFGFAVIKPNLPEDLHPWLTWDGRRVQLNSSWMEARFQATQIREYEEIESEVASQP